MHIYIVYAGMEMEADFGKSDDDLVGGEACMMSGLGIELMLLRESNDVRIRCAWYCVSVKCR